MKKDNSIWIKVEVKKCPACSTPLKKGIQFAVDEDSDYKEIWHCPQCGYREEE
ncbi:MAG: zf-TFIIB domain-containing protein [Thaumarchaeota archaeon]|nr:zf-TFIIB domain-containing protein [Nitrososphaerota archaeon]